MLGLHNVVQAMFAMIQDLLVYQTVPVQQQIKVLAIIQAAMPIRFRVRLHPSANGEYQHHANR
jgi:hypothetical protein